MRSEALSTPDLHEAFVERLHEHVIDVSDYASKPFDIEMRIPFRPIRLYIYNLVNGIGTKRPYEFKAVLRVFGQPAGKYASFAPRDNYDTVLAGFDVSTDVFVFWDPVAHPRFKNGGNVQVARKTILDAMENGAATQVRQLSGGRSEVVFACVGKQLVEILQRRLGLNQ